MNFGQIFLIFGRRRQLVKIGTADNKMSQAVNIISDIAGLPAGKNPGKFFFGGGDQIYFLLKVKIKNNANGPISMKPPVTVGGKKTFCYQGNFGIRERRRPNPKKVNIKTGPETLINIIQAAGIVIFPAAVTD